MGMGLGEGLLGQGEGVQAAKQALLLTPSRDLPLTHHLLLNTLRQVVPGAAVTSATDCGVARHVAPCRSRALWQGRSTGMHGCQQAGGGTSRMSPLAAA